MSRPIPRTTSIIEIESSPEPAPPPSPTRNAKPQRRTRSQGPPSPPRIIEGPTANGKGKQKATAIANRGEGGAGKGGGAGKDKARALGPVIEITDSEDEDEEDVVPVRLAPRMTQAQVTAASAAARANAVASGSGTQVKKKDEVIEMIEVVNIGTKVEVEKKAKEGETHEKMKTVENGIGKDAKKDDDDSDEVELVDYDPVFAAKRFPFDAQFMASQSQSRSQSRATPAIASAATTSSTTTATPRHPQPQSQPTAGPSRLPARTPATGPATAHIRTPSTSSSSSSMPGSAYTNANGRRIHLPRLLAELDELDMRNVLVQKKTAKDVQERGWKAARGNDEPVVQRVQREPPIAAPVGVAPMPPTPVRAPSAPVQGSAVQPVVAPLPPVVPPPQAAVPPPQVQAQPVDAAFVNHPVQPAAALPPPAVPRQPLFANVEPAAAPAAAPAPAPVVQAPAPPAALDEDAFVAQTVAQILGVLPDIEVAYLERMIRANVPFLGADTGERVLGALVEGGAYPRVGGMGNARVEREDVFGRVAAPIVRPPAPVRDDVDVFGRVERVEEDIFGRVAAPVVPSAPAPAPAVVAAPAPVAPPPPAAAPAVVAPVVVAPAPAAPAPAPNPAQNLDALIASATAQVLSVFPDIERAYLDGNVRAFAVRFGEETGPRLIGALVESGYWPKEVKANANGKNGNGKGRALEDGGDGGEGPAKKRVKVDYETIDRPFEGGVHYVELALVRSFSLFMHLFTSRLFYRSLMLNLRFLLTDPPPMRIPLHPQSPPPPSPLTTQEPLRARIHLPRIHHRPHPTSQPHHQPTPSKRTPTTLPHNMAPSRAPHPPPSSGRRRAGFPKRRAVGCGMGA
ncbi:hypothetical protein BDN70DRAFT_674510 [Pholiota conissans]|uniref:Uncharacterized protein n=1 Tax=Pholiota conissans TaxID=109636 RepID=A0A9P6D0S8_9AGAR|nr:hypothetical protein BDN70DRAFT_674510 [Pholiota conissans]